MELSENEISKIVFDSSLKVHKALGPGLLESAYEACLYYELGKNNVRVEKQKTLPLVYETIKLDVGYRVDLIIDNKVIIEVKSVDTITNIHISQILTYLKLSKCKLGMIINFNEGLIKDGIKRVVNNL